jgi:hypothetical protein
MSEYVDTQLINCNRLASVESRTGNDSNPAVFTNPLEQSIKLNVGDRISLERAFISEVGAGQPSTIEYKGETTGRNPVAPYCDITYGDKYYKMDNVYDPKYRLGYYRSITTTLKTDDTVELRDNLAPLVIGYYITSNEFPNYIQQPRRTISAAGFSTRGQVGREHPKQYSNGDSFDEGACRVVVNTGCVLIDDWGKKTAGGSQFIYKQRIDNTRYTLFIKDKIAYSVGAKDNGNNNDTEQFPKKYHNGIIQEANYIRYREKLDIEVNKGFNTPSAVASQITQQLTETKNENIFNVYDHNYNIRAITKTIETNTYKPINAQNIYNVCATTLTAYGNQALPVTDANIDQLAVDYIATFGYIAVKRPEIFEKGREMHKLLYTQQPVIRDNLGNMRLNRLDPFEGFQTYGDRPAPTASPLNQDTTITITVLYTEANLKIIRDFFDTQILYPEIWDALIESQIYSDGALGTLSRPTIKDSRFFHMNELTTDPTQTRHNKTFGEDMYVDPPAPNNDEQHITLPCFFKYDDTMRDVYYEPDDSFAQSHLSYGFAKPTRIANYDAAGNRLDDIYLITLSTDGVGGVPRKLFTENTTPVDPNYRSIEEGRRIGYDHHATAYSTAIITPHCGYTNCDIGVTASFQDGAGHLLPNQEFPFPSLINFIRSTTDTNHVTDLNPYMTMTYIGANNPEIRYNTETNRFELSRFHTANNVGNKRQAGNTAAFVNNKTSTPPLNLNSRLIKPPEKNQDAGDTVYKINPRPCSYGFSPTFKPYGRNNAAFRTNVYPETAEDTYDNFNDQGTNTQKYEGFNPSIEPYTIFDSHGGIYIDDWGFDESNWEDNLWDILGFDYNAVNAPPTKLNVLTKRVDNENSDLLYRPTTNAEVVTTDTKNYVSNEFGAVMYYTSLPYPNCVVNYRAVHGGGNYLWVTGGDPDGSAINDPVKAQPLELWSEINILTESTTITATDIQKSVLRPYYTIRSDILEGHSAIGGNPTGANLPIISIVDKYSAASDYFLGNPSDMVFTVTKPTMIGDITTSIHDSDGKYANVDKTSAVIYKIQRTKRTPPSIIQEILQDEADEEKKEKKKKK